MKFRSHISKNGTLFFAGRTDSNNEELISQVKPEELVFHTAAAGSPFVNIKENALEGDIKEAAILCARYSREWKKNKTDIEVHIFKGKEISKSKTMKLGTFGVKNFKKIKIKKEDIENFKPKPAKKGDLIRLGIIKDKVIKKVNKK